MLVHPFLVLVQLMHYVALLSCSVGSDSDGVVRWCPLLALAHKWAVRGHSLQSVCPVRREQTAKAAIN